MHTRLVLLLAAFALVGCYDELYHGVEERDANEMVVALQQSGVDAQKIRDDRDPERWVVRVPDGAHVEAIHALQQRGLPRPEVNGFDAFYPSDGLVPTSSEERVLLQYATSQELRRSLLAVDGVIDAHVNLVLPETSRLRTRPTRPGRASVIVRYEGSGDTPISAAEVKRVISGGVEELSPDAVEVLLSPSRETLVPLEPPRLKQVGPIAVTADSRTFAQVVFGAMTMLILGLAAALVIVLLRRRRTS